MSKEPPRETPGAAKPQNSSGARRRDLLLSSSSLLAASTFTATGLPQRADAQQEQPAAAA